MAKPKKKAKKKKRRNRTFTSLDAAEKAYLEAMELAHRMDMAWRNELERKDPDVAVWGDWVVEAYNLAHPSGGYVVVRRPGEPKRRASCLGAEDWVHRMEKRQGISPLDLMQATRAIRAFWESLKHTNETGS